MNVQMVNDETIATEWAIEAENMRVDYGNTVAVKGLTLKIPYGEVYGLVGSNGAGKTSTFSVWATLIQPTYGNVKVGGVDILESPDKAREMMAYMPDLAPVPSDLKVWEFLDLFARSYGYSASEGKERWTDCLNMVDLWDKRNDFCKDLSRGMKQRVNLAKAILHHPKVIILDEPASGMDPQSRAKLRVILKKMAAEGTTVVVSSHILNELSDMCTSVGILHHGELIDHGELQQVVDRGEGGEAQMLILVAGEQALKIAELKKYLDEKHAAQNLEPTIMKGGVVVTVSGGMDEQAALLTQLVSEGIEIRSYTTLGSGIEQRLMEINR
ncbi:MAG: ABC-2 type transport system ATP-binding protein [Rubritalea sp.]|jgi:ABC-2 type transport system ATP-binding protein